MNRVDLANASAIGRRNPEKRIPHALLTLMTLLSARSPPETLPLFL